MAKNANLGNMLGRSAGEKQVHRYIDAPHIGAQKYESPGNEIRRQGAAFGRLGAALQSFGPALAAYRDKDKADEEMMKYRRTVWQDAVDHGAKPGEYDPNSPAGKARTDTTFMTGHDYIAEKAIDYSDFKFRRSKDIVTKYQADREALGVSQWELPDGEEETVDEVTGEKVIKPKMRGVTQGDLVLWRNQEVDKLWKAYPGKDNEDIREAGKNIIEAEFAARYKARYKFIQDQEIERGVDMAKDWGPQSLVELDKEGVKVEDLWDAAMQDIQEPVLGASNSRELSKETKAEAVIDGLKRRIKGDDPNEALDAARVTLKLYDGGGYKVNGRPVRLQNSGIFGQRFRETAVLAAKIEQQARQAQAMAERDAAIRQHIKSKQTFDSFAWSDVQVSDPRFGNTVNAYTAKEAKEAFALSIIAEVNAPRGVVRKWSSNSERIDENFAAFRFSGVLHPEFAAKAKSYTLDPDPDSRQQLEEAYQIFKQGTVTQVANLKDYFPNDRFKDMQSLHALQASGVTFKEAAELLYQSKQGDGSQDGLVTKMYGDYWGKAKTKFRKIYGAEAMVGIERVLNMRFQKNANWSSQTEFNDAVKTIGDAYTQGQAKFNDHPFEAPTGYDTESWRNSVSSFVDVVGLDKLVPNFDDHQVQRINGGYQLFNPKTGEFARDEKGDRYTIADQDVLEIQKWMSTAADNDLKKAAMKKIKQRFGPHYNEIQKRIIERQEAEEQALQSDYVSP